jgi:hypothetical protein
MTGLLVLPEGEIVNYVHMGYGSTYELYTLLEIDSGNLKKEIKLGYEEYEEFKDKQFEAFKKTDEYEKIKTETLCRFNNELEYFKEQDYDDSFIDAFRSIIYDDEYIESFFRQFIIDYSSKILVE